MHQDNPSGSDFRFNTLGRTEPLILPGSPLSKKRQDDHPSPLGISVPLSPPFWGPSPWYLFCDHLGVFWFSRNDVKQKIGRAINTIANQQWFP